MKNKMKKNIKKKKGAKSQLRLLRINPKAFTSLELLIVIVLVAIIGLTSVPFLSRFFTQNATSDTYARLLGELRKAQTYAMMGKQNGPWGVFYDTSGGAKKIILYQGNTYASHVNSAFDESFKLNPNVTVTGLNDINFSQVTGTTGVNTTITISGTSNTTRTIQVNSQGIVNFALAGPTNTPTPTPNAPTPTPTPTIPPNWYNPSWLYRQAITIDHTKVPSTQTNFPVLINLASNANLTAHALASGNDILFTDSTGTTKYSHEIEKYTSATGALVAWVKIPSLSSTTNTTIYMFYGNPAAGNQQNATGTWDSNYKDVYHMNQSPPAAIVDSTSTANNGTPNNMTSANQIAGKIGGALNFNGTNQYIVTNSSAGLPTTDFTYELWENTANSVNNPEFFNTLADQINVINAGGGVDVHSHISYSFTSFTSINDNTTYAIVVSRSGSTMFVYINGVQDGNVGTDGTAYTQSCTFMIGADSNSNCLPGGNYMSGMLDEMRVSNIARSANWVKTEYNNQNSPATFYSIAAQEIY
jgi:Tfp pilus assembly protein FimT